MPGQRLVSREGDLWRWDGFVAASEGMSAAAMRLEQRNRLLALEQEEAEIAGDFEARSGELDAASKALQSAQENERQLRSAWRDAQNELGAVRAKLDGVQRRIAETETKLAAITGARQRSEAERDEQRRQVNEAEAALSPQAQVTVIESINGHAAGFGRGAADRRHINQAIAAFLAESEPDAHK